MGGKTTDTVKALKAHLALNVRDVEESTEFYRRMLGIEPCKVRRGYAKFDVENPPLNLTLNQNPFRERGALSHLGIQVASTEDVLAVRERWAQAGLPTHDEMQTNCCYALQDKTWVRDPDGNEWEVFVVLEDNLAETSMCCVGEEAEPSAIRLSASCATDAGAAATAEASSASSCGCATASTEPAVTAAASCCGPTATPVLISR